MMEEIKNINREIRSRLDNSVKKYKLLARDISDLERAIATGNAQELSLAVERIYDHADAIVAQLGRVGQLAFEKVLFYNQRQYVNEVLIDAEGNLQVIYMIADEIERNIKNMTREQINEALREIKQEYNELAENLKKAYAIIEF